jgi:predicted porin
MKTLFAALLLSLSLPAAGQPYVWGMGSSMKADLRTTPDVSGSDRTSFHAGAGWRFNTYVAAELGYLGTGSFNAAGGSWRADGFGLAAIGTLPIAGPWSLVGKAGAYRLKSKFNTPGIVVNTKLGSRPLFALGAQYHVGDALHLQLLYQQFSGKNGAEIDKLRMISLGAMLQF